MTSKKVQSFKKNCFVYFEVNLKSQFSSLRNYTKGPFTQAMFAAIFLLLMHVIEWIDLRTY